MPQRTDLRAVIAGKGSTLCRWFITLTVILFISIYQLGIQESPVYFSQNEKIPVQPQTQAVKTPDKTQAASSSSVVVEPVIEAGQSTAHENQEKTAVAPIDSGPWKDGEYEGEAEGYGGPIRIKLLIANGWISEIIILDASGEDKPYLRDAKKIIPKVIKKQSTDLDAISGATTTCWAILDAVDLALEEGSL